jgi:hypothetical protein
MPLRSTTSFASLLKAAACAVALTLPPCQVQAQAPAQAAAGPFEAFDGSWTGAGTISMRGGTNERIRCRVNYMITERGRLLSQDLRCASDSYKFELQTTVAHESGKITGTWNETTRQVVGSISGKVNGGDIEGVATSSAFTANLAISTRGNQQSVSIRSPGSEVSELAITLRKGAR